MNDNIEDQTVGATLTITTKKPPNPKNISLSTTLTHKQVAAAFPKILEQEKIKPDEIVDIQPESMFEYLKEVEKL